MTSPRPPSRPLDLAAIRFPSDRITLADIRRVHATRFDAEVGGGFEHLPDDADFTLDTLLYLERLLARATFEKARGRRGDYLSEVGLLDRGTIVKELTAHYRTYGVARGGKHTTEQLVRDIEAQAAAQVGRRR